MLHQKLFGLLVLLLPCQLGRHFWPDWAFVLGLRVDYLSPTLYLTDLLVAAILVLWFKESWRPWRLSLLISSFFLFLTLTSTLATNAGAAFYKLLRLLEMTGLGFYVARNPGTKRTVFNVLPWAVLYSCFLALAQFIKQSSLGSFFYYLGERTFSLSTPGIAKAIVNGRLFLRPYATFPHPNALAGFSLVSLVMAWPKIRGWRLRFFCGFLVAGVIGFTFSRSAWLVGLLILAFWFKKKRLFLLMAFCLLLVVNLFLFGRRFSGPEAFFQRWQLTKAALTMIWRQPLTGVGLNNFVVLLPKISPVRWLQPVHNIYLLVAVETGLTGLVVFWWFLFLTFHRLWLTRRIFLATALSAVLLLGFFDHYWVTLQQNQLLLALIFGLAWLPAKGRVKMVS